jgi:hypothetical protein
VFGAETARALDALLALEECVSAEMRHGGVVAMESVPFARPSGVSMYEADALTWRLYHTHASCVVNAINNAQLTLLILRAIETYKAKGEKIRKFCIPRIYWYYNLKWICLSQHGTIAKKR